MDYLSTRFYYHFRYQTHLQASQLHQSVHVRAPALQIIVQLLVPNKCRKMIYYFFWSISVLTLSIFFAFSISRRLGWLESKTFSTCQKSKVRTTKYMNQNTTLSTLAQKSYKCTSFNNVSVWRISISAETFPTPFCNWGKSFLNWSFVVPLSLSALGVTPWLNECLTPLPPWWDIPGSSPTHRISSGEICH